MDLNFEESINFDSWCLCRSHVSEIIAKSGQIWYNKVLKFRALLYKLLAFSIKHSGSLEVWPDWSLISKFCLWSGPFCGTKLTGDPTGSNSSSVSKSVEHVEEESSRLGWVRLWQKWFACLCWLVGVWQLTEDTVSLIETFPSYCLILLLFTGQLSLISLEQLSDLSLT